MRPSATDSISVCRIQRATLDAGVGIVTQHHDCALALVRGQPRDIGIVCIPVGPRGAEEVGAESAPKGDALLCLSLAWNRACRRTPIARGLTRQACEPAARQAETAERLSMSQTPCEPRPIC